MKTTIFALFLSLLVFYDSTFTQTNQTKEIFEKQTDTKSVNPNEILAGTILLVQIESEISSINSAVNDTFTTILVDPIIVNGIVILPSKTMIQGRIIKVEKSARGGTSGILEVAFDKVTFLDGSSRDLKGELVDVSGKSTFLRGKSSTLENVVIVGSGIGVGTAIGVAAGGSNRSIIGGLLGAGIGISSVFIKKGDEAVLKANSKLKVRIKETVNLPVKDF
jgi:hypothetical protein